MSSDRGSNIFDIWQIAIDGSGIRPLTRAQGAWNPKTLPDGSVLYSSANSTWRVAPQGGAATRVTEAHVYRPSVSPDGTRFVCRYREPVTSPARPAVYQIGEATRRKLFDLPATPTPRLTGVRMVDRCTTSTREKAFRTSAASVWMVSRGSLASYAVLITSER